MTKDRRKHKRMPVGMAVGVDMPDGRVVRARALDVSQAGVSLECDAETARAMLQGVGAGDAVRVKLRWLDPLAVGLPAVGEATVSPVRSQQLANGAYRIGFSGVATGGAAREAALLDAPSLQVPADMQTEFRRIVEQINLDLADRPSRAMLVTSTEAGEGVSTVSWWLASSLAERFHGEILFLDATPAATAAEPGAGGDGLIEIARDPEAADRICQPTALPNLRILRAWPGQGAGGMQVTDQQISDALSALKRRFSYVLIDAPPPMLSPLTLVLSRHSDAALLVIEASTTDRQRVAAAADLLRKGGARIIGAVLNKGGRR